MLRLPPSRHNQPAIPLTQPFAPQTRNRFQTTMPITGQVNDLSLGELIELFCNKRKTGRLTVTYPEGVAYFYLKPGAITHASFGNLSGAPAVDYALSLATGSFTFSAGVEAEEQTINRPWTSVVLEGLRRLDEGIAPQKPFADSPAETEAAKSTDRASDEAADRPATYVPAFGFLSANYDKRSLFATSRWSSRTVIVAVVLAMMIIGVPWGWYTHRKATRLEQNQAASKIENPQQAAPSPIRQSVTDVSKK